MLQYSTRIVLFLMTVLSLSACGGRNNSSSAFPQGDTIPLHYAEHLSLVNYGSYTVAQLRNPWDTTQLLHTYLLVDKKDSLPSTLPQGTLIRTPLSKAVVYSSVHVSLLQQLGALSSVGGICDLPYMKLPEIKEAYQKGLLANGGDSMNPDIEALINLHPDGILLSPFENSGYGRIEKLNVPIIECADYMETSALGRAEWMRFYGLLFGKRAQADSLFAQVEKEYKALKQQVAQVATTAPTIISELKTGSVWYIPGGKSTTARIYADAGANYIFASDEHSGSVPLSFETVFDKGQNADLWLIKYNQPVNKTYAELQKDYAPYANFHAFKQRNIYGCNTNSVLFYEESPFRPDFLLKDLIKIIHPSLLKGYELRYFTHLAD